MTNLSDLGNKEVFAKNLLYYLEYYNKDSINVCRDLDIPASTFSDWLNAKKYPRIDKIELLANYFNVKKSDLIENKHKDTEPSIPTLEQYKILFDKDTSLTDNQREFLINFLEERHKEIDSNIDNN